jgi:hypothetical protein
MNTYTWIFPTLDAYLSYGGETDVVITVCYQLLANNGAGVTASVSGQFGVTYTPGTPFIPFDQLTQEIVEGWANEALDVPSLEQQLDALIYQTVNPTVASLTPPWVSPPSTTSSLEPVSEPE